MLSNPPYKDGNYTLFTTIPLKPLYDQYCVGDIVVFRVELKIISFSKLSLSDLRRCSNSLNLDSVYRNVLGSIGIIMVQACMRI